MNQKDTGTKKSFSRASHDARPPGGVCVSSLKGKKLKSARSHLARLKGKLATAAAETGGRRARADAA